MNESNEFTAKEKYLISLYRDDLDGLVRRAWERRLTIVVPSTALVAYAWMTGQAAFGLLGFGLLLGHGIYQLSKLRRGMVTMAVVLRKYEAQLLAKSGGG